MRITPTAMARTARKALTTVAVAAAATGFTVLAGGTASATTLQPDSCTAAVTGQAGDKLVVRGESVKDLVRRGAQEAKSIVLVHDLTIWPDHLANEISKKQLDVGSVPDARSSRIGGDVLGAAVRQAMRGSAGLGLLPATQETTLNKIAKKVAGNCGLSVFAADHTAPSTSPSQPGTSTGQPGGTPSSPTTTPESRDAGTGGLEGSGGATVAPRDYSGIPAATAPSAGIAAPPNLRYPPSSGVPGRGTSPEFGILGADDGAQNGKSADVRNAGNADALAAAPSGNAVQLPMLIAVVALAGVTAALVRTWVLRKAV